MKFAICNETFVDAPFAEACRIAAKYGYDGIELAPFTFDPDVVKIPSATRREIKETAARFGLDIVGLHWLLAKTNGLHLTHPDQGVRARTGAYLAELVRFCRDVGGRVLVFGSPDQRSLAAGMSFEEGVEHAAEVFRSVCNEAEDSGIVLAFEPLSSEATNFGGNLAEGLQVIARVDHPSFKLHFDTIAMAGEPEPMDRLAERYIHLIEHIHVNDVNKLGPGMGELDHAPLLETLARLGYDKYLSVEVFRTDPGPERIARESIAYLRSLLES